MKSDEKPRNERNEPDMCAHKNCRCSPSYGGPICEPCQIRYHIARHKEKDARIAELEAEVERLRERVRIAERASLRDVEFCQDAAPAVKDAMLMRLEAHEEAVRERSQPPEEDLGDAPTRDRTPAEQCDHEWGGEFLPIGGDGVWRRCRKCDSMLQVDAPAAFADPPVTRRELGKVLRQIFHVDALDKQICLDPDLCWMVDRLERGQDARGEL